ILGRNLEHSRIYTFVNADDPQIFIGSADTMHRNLDRRVETLVKIEQADHISYIDGLFREAFDGATSAWDLDAEGNWVRQALDNSERKDLQDSLMSQITKKNSRKNPLDE